jgi:hypothetical protein
MKYFNPIRIVIYVSILTILAMSLVSCGTTQCGAQKFRNSGKYYG